MKKKEKRKKKENKNENKNKKKYSCIDGIRTHDPLGQSFFGGLDAK